MSIEHQLADIKRSIIGIKHQLAYLVKASQAGNEPALLERYAQELKASSDALQQSVDDATTESEDPR